MGDMVAPLAPLCYMFGRIGNFINGELYGRETKSAIGMYFPMDSEHILRHPSQLYEAFFEGAVLFIVLWNIRKKKQLKNIHLSVYLFGYGFVRFFIEFFREPDEQLGLLWLNLSMGQLLCIAMMLAGIVSAVLIKRFVKDRYME